MDYQCKLSPHTSANLEVRKHTRQTEYNFRCNKYIIMDMDCIARVEGSTQDRFLLHTNINYLLLTSINSLITLECENSHMYLTFQDPPLPANVQLHSPTLNQRMYNSVTKTVHPSDIIVQCTSCSSLSRGMWLFSLLHSCTQEPVS